MERVLTEGAPLPGVRDVLPALAKASEDRVAFSRMIVGQVEAGRGAFARAEMTSGRGSAVMGRLRTLIGNMDATMGNQLANAKARKADAKADIDRTLQAMLVLLGVTVTASAIAGILTIRGQATRLERQENLSNAIIDPILVLDSAGTILFANRATQQQFGYTSEELHGASADVLLAEWPHGEQVALGLGRLHPVDVQTGIVRDFLFRRRNGTRFRGNVSVGIAEEDGAPRFIAVVRPHLSLPASTQAGKAPGKANATPTTAFVLDLLGSLRARIVSADTPGAQSSHAGQVDKH
jgi:PAS domain S-box-containing protein